MKKLIIILFLVGFTMPCFAATVGSPEISIPEESLYLREEAIKEALDRYEVSFDIKAGAEVEIIFDRDLSSAPADVTNAEMDGQVYMLKFSNNYYDVFEPYVKIGTSSFEVEWTQHDQKVKVEGSGGLGWCIGAKAKLMEFEDYGVKLTLDAQRRNLDVHVDSATIDGSELDAAAVGRDFAIKEWQISLLASKKYILPLQKDYYIVPYTGITFIDSDIDAHFTQSTTGGLYSTYNASDENVFGIVLGCDVMLSLLDWYLFNFELRLINETALTFSGRMKF